VHEEELDSVIGMIQSQLEVSLSRLLQDQR
jgi:hypothetical protein